MKNFQFKNSESSLLHLDVSSSQDFQSLISDQSHKSQEQEVTDLLYSLNSHIQLVQDALQTVLQYQSSSRRGCSESYLQQVLSELRSRKQVIDQERQISTSFIRKTKQLVESSLEGLKRTFGGDLDQEGRVINMNQLKNTANFRTNSMLDTIPQARGGEGQFRELDRSISTVIDGIVQQLIEGNTVNFSILNKYYEQMKRQVPGTAKGLYELIDCIQQFWNNDSNQKIAELQQQVDRQQKINLRMNRDLKLYKSQFNLNSSRSKTRPTSALKMRLDDSEDSQGLSLLKENIKEELRTERQNASEIYQNKVDNLEREIMSMRNALADIQNDGYSRSFLTQCSKINQDSLFETSNLQEIESKLDEFEHQKQNFILTINELNKQVDELNSTLQTEREQSKDKIQRVKEQNSSTINQISKQINRLISTAQTPNLQLGKTLLDSLISGLQSILNIHNIKQKPQIQLGSPVQEQVPYPSTRLQNYTQEIYKRYDQSPANSEVILGDDFSERQGQSLIPSISASPTKPSASKILDMYLLKN